MKQRLFILLIALLAIVTGAKAQKDPIVIPGTLELELYSGEELNEAALKVLIFYADKANLTAKPDGQGGGIFYKGKTELFSIKVKDKQGRVTVPTGVTWKHNLDPVDVTRAELRELGITVAYDKISVVFSVTINSTNFTDETFRTYVSENFDKNINNKGRITKAEAEAVSEIAVSEKGITSLKGVEYFTNLEVLRCNNNQLEELDVSKNTKLDLLNCSQNQLSTLDMSKNTVLTNLDCDNNQLTSINVSGCSALEFLDFAYNQLTTLNVESNTALSWLVCYNNLLTSLDLSKNTALTYLDCLNNQLNSLDVSGKTNLKNLSFGDKYLTTVDMSGCTALPYVYIEYGQNYPLAKLNASGCTAITFFSFYNTKLEELDVSGCTSLTDLNCNNNQLTTLDVSGCTALEDLGCKGNQLTSLDVSGCTNLLYLNCNRNKLTSLNASDCTSLKELYCEENQLTSLDVSGCTALTSVYCDNNQLASLNVSGCTALTKLYCQHNQLTSFDVSGCTALTSLSCLDNQIRGAAMTALVESLPGDKESASLIVYRSPENNIMTRAHAQAAIMKGWIPKKWDEIQNDYVAYDGESVPADANGDGEVTAADVETISDYILGRLAPGSWFDEESADVVDDGVVDIQDLTQLIKQLTE